MQIFAIGSALFTIIAGTWIGLRLFGLSKRTGKKPERFIGISMLSFGAVAYPLFLVTVLGARTLSHESVIGLSTVANAAYMTCLISIALFTRTVFRPDSKWGSVGVGIVAAVGITGSICSISNTVMHPGVEHAFDELARWGGALISGAFGLGFLWTSIEAFIYRSALRRRMGLGLADPAVVNRFSVWALGTGIAATTDFALVFSSMLALNPAEHPLPALLQSASGLACAITWTLTFAPSEMYMNWVRGRATQVADAHETS